MLYNMLLLRKSRYPIIFCKFIRIHQSNKIVINRQVYVVSYVENSWTVWQNYFGKLYNTIDTNFLQYSKF